MLDEQPRRKQRIPLTAEELFYVKKIKELKEQERIFKFKSTKFYKICNGVNIVLVGILSYCLLSIWICTYWQQATIAHVTCNHSKYNKELKAAEITSVEIETTNALKLTILTSEFYNTPEAGQHFFIGRDFLFHKILKVKFNSSEHVFWHQFTYPKLTLLIFAAGVGFFIYKMNRHLTFNGLIISVVLNLIADLYFIAF